MRQTTDKFSVLELTSEGLAVLKQRKPVTLVKPAATPNKLEHRTGEITCDEALFEVLRQLRRRLAEERSVPPYIIFSDVALRQMARTYPATEAEFARISGVGEKKLQEFGKVFLVEIGAYLRTNPRQVFAEDSIAASPAKPWLGDTARASLDLFRKGKSVEAIACERSLTVGTIYTHLAAALETGEPIDINRCLTTEEQARVAEAFAKHGWENLTGAHQALGGRIDYGKLRLFRAAQE